MYHFLYKITKKVKKFIKSQKITKNPKFKPKNSQIQCQNLLEINQTVATLKCHSCEQRKICDYTCQIIGQ